LFNSQKQKTVLNQNLRVRAALMEALMAAMAALMAALMEALMEALMAALMAFRRLAVSTRSSSIR